MRSNNQAKQAVDRSGPHCSSRSRIAKVMFLTTGWVLQGSGRRAASTLSVHRGAARMIVRKLNLFSPGIDSKAAEAESYSVVVTMVKYRGHRPTGRGFRRRIRIPHHLPCSCMLGFRINMSVIGVWGVIQDVELSFLRMASHTLKVRPVL